MSDETKKKLKSNTARLSVSESLVLPCLSPDKLNCVVQSSIHLHTGNSLLHNDRCESSVNAGGDELLHVRECGDIFGTDAKNFA